MSLGIAAGAALITSLFLPIATARQTQGLSTIGGFEILFIGAFGPLAGQFGWFATPCLVTSIMLLLKRRPIGFRPTVALIVAMTAFLADALTWNDYPNDGGGGPIVHYGTGYYVWVTAVVLGVAALSITLLRRSVR